QLESALDQQISVLEGSLLLSRILHQERLALPAVRIDRSLTESVADMRLQQFEINQLREQLRNQENYLNRLLNQLPEEQREPLRDDLQQLIRSRAILVEQLSSHKIGRASCRERVEVAGADAARRKKGKVRTDVEPRGG